jgi:hypothetical protein
MEKENYFVHCFTDIVKFLVTQRVRELTRRIVKKLMKIVFNDTLNQRLLL